ncbi:MAG: DnaJ family domain-containing protein [Pseudomonadota bacterium]
MLFYLKLVEQRIKEAQEKGDFDNLPGEGKPLKLDDDGHLPEDLRIAYKILKNADCLPPEIETMKEIRQMEDLLEGLTEEREKYKLIKKINYKIMKLNITGNRSPLLDDKHIYYGKLVRKLDHK